MMVSHRRCIFVGIWTVTWTLIPFGWYIGKIAGVSDWRSVLCCVARMSCLPEFPDTACLKYFRDIGRKCVLDLNAGETYTRVWSPECGLGTHCRVAVVPSDTVAQVRGCTRMRGKWTFPGRNTGCTGSRCFPGRDEVRGRLRLYKAGLCG